VTSDQTDDGDEPPLDALLGQPRMVSDPRISVAQAAQILGKSPVRVYRMVKLGRLRRRGEPNKFRGLLLSDCFSAVSVGIRSRSQMQRRCLEAPRGMCGGSLPRAS
jgi:hypothetical protein